MIIVFFFFSSRRRHTRFDCDWSSDVCSSDLNMAKLLASQAAWDAANGAIDAYGGYGFAREFDVERKFRETRLLLVAPISNNLVLAYIGQHILGMPRSY